MKQDRPILAWAVPAVVGAAFPVLASPGFAVEAPEPDDDSDFFSSAAG
ncbi:MAG: hypothetical protein HY922_00925 [Elusimicrobia bacterium]|nr:hypothetical protein [Elusimicrobiota bacterium]